jgi:hypothetical protein
MVKIFEAIREMGSEMLGSLHEEERSVTFVQGYKATISRDNSSRPKVQALDVAFPARCNQHSVNIERMPGTIKSISRRPMSYDRNDSLALSNGK